MVVLGPLLVAAAALAQGRGGTLKGSIKLASGATVSGASVILSSPEDRGPLYITATDGDGWFAFGALESGRYRLRAALPGQALAGEQEVLVRAPFAAVSHVTLEPRKPERARPDATVPGGARRLAGKLLDRSGRPLRRVLLQLRAEGDASAGRILTSDDSGAFQAEGLEPRRYSLFVHRTGYADILMSNLDLTAGEREIAVTLVPFYLDINAELAALGAEVERLLPMETVSGTAFRSRGYELPPPPDRDE
jgi:hypothetical protein